MFFGPIHCERIQFDRLDKSRTIDLSQKLFLVSMIALLLERSEQQQKTSCSFISLNQDCKERNECEDTKTASTCIGFAHRSYRSAFKSRNHRQWCSSNFKSETTLWNKRDQLCEESHFRRMGSLPEVGTSLMHHTYKSQPWCPYQEPCYNIS